MTEMDKRTRAAILAMDPENLELGFDIMDIENASLSRTDDADGDIKTKSHRIVRENCAAVLRDERVPVEFWKFLARGMLAYLDGEHKSIESALRLNGKHGKKPFTPDQEANAIDAYLAHMRSLPSDQAMIEATPHALSAAYAALYGESPAWHLKNPNEDGEPTVRTVRDRLRRLRQLLQQHGYLWQPDDTEQIHAMNHAIEDCIFNRK
ncbi:hypothetical protein [Burkholderia sp. Ax-1719]|uniref:hypothetical protein n=1 Tax=Burkholderia sp. Ax-1719 TaxID=2608334 RepID=UPI00141F3A1D|nr:hypothetical protein [Burkholderia sp. Ax-1719]NIE64026.1 hypothetical protein [Burkholderia sp. Ax-1719]